MKKAILALGALFALGCTAIARPSRDLGPLGNVAWTARTVQVVLTRLDLGRSQRDKIFELIGNARREANDITRNRHLTFYERQDRLTDVSTELRGRIIHVLTGEQKDRLNDILGRGRDDRRDDRNRDDGPRYRTPNTDRGDWPWN